MAADEEAAEDVSDELVAMGSLYPEAFRRAGALSGPHTLRLGGADVEIYIPVRRN